MRVHDRFMEATKWKDGRRVFKDLT
jgi:hypothetical protein